MLAHSSHGSCLPRCATYGPRETQGSHSVTRPVSGCPSHGPRPSGSSTSGARVKVRLAPLRPYRPPFTRNVLHSEFHVRHHWEARILVASWAALGVSGRLLGASRGPLGASWERPGGLPEGLEGRLGATPPKRVSYDPFWDCLVALLGLPWGPPEALWGPLGRPLDRLGELLGCLGAS